MVDWRIDAVFAVSVVRLGTLLVGLYALTLAAIKKGVIQPASPSPITTVVVQEVQPRRALIISILLFSAFTYFLDGLLVVILWLVYGLRQSRVVEWRFVELADAAGLIAFSIFLFIGIRKDMNGVDFWTRKRVKAFALLAIAIDIAYLALLLLTIPIFHKPPQNPQIPELPTKRGIYVPNFLHFIALDVRILLLAILLLALFKPFKTYSTIHRRPESPGDAATLLLPNHGLTMPPPHPEYGTFAEASSHAASKGKADGAGEPEGQHHDAPRREYVTADPEIESVPNPVTDDPDALKTSYAAVAAKALDKEAEDESAPKPGEVSGHPPSDPVAYAGGRESPVGFPTRDDSSSVRGVTFGGGGSVRETPPEGSEVKDKKRRRISSQNLQKIVRRISLVPRRTPSISSQGSKGGEPGTTPKRDITGSFFARKSREDSRASGEGSSLYSGTVEDSPATDAPAAEGEDDQDGSKGKGKSKKIKRKSLKV